MESAVDKSVRTDCLSVFYFVIILQFFLQDQHHGISAADVLRSNLPPHSQELLPINEFFVAGDDWSNGTYGGILN